MHAVEPDSAYSWLMVGNSTFFSKTPNYFILLIILDYNKYRYSPMKRLAPGLGNIIPKKYLRRMEE